MEVLTFIGVLILIKVFNLYIGYRIGYNQAITDMQEARIKRK